MDVYKQVLDGQSPHVGANIGGMLKGRRVFRRHLLYKRRKKNKLHTQMCISTDMCVYVSIYVNMSLRQTQ